MQHLYPVPGTRPFRNDEYLRKVKYRAVERRTLLHLQFKCIYVYVFSYLSRYQVYPVHVP